MRSRAGPRKQKQQTASRSTSTSDEITITLPIHPFAGKRLRVRREIRRVGAVSARCDFEVEDPHGRTVTVPLAWTDRAPPTGLLVPADGVHAAAPQLLALARLVREVFDPQVADPTTRTSSPARVTLPHGAAHASASLPDSVAPPRSRASAADRLPAGRRRAAGTARGRRNVGGDR